MNPKVSICVPTYEQPELIRRLLNSIINQSFKDYEVIITDDSLSVSVKNVVKDYYNLSRIKYFKNTERKGSPKNWNEAVKHASGKYIKIMHHDDWFTEEDSLLEFVKMLDENSDANFAFCSSTNIGKDQQIQSIHTPTKKELIKLSRNPNNLLMKNTIGAPTATIYKNKLGIHYDTRLKWHVDVDFYIRVLNENNKFVFNPKPLVSVDSDSSNRVTSECANNREINLFEFFYIFHKIETNKISDYKYFKFIIRNKLFYYDVRSVDEIIELGINSPLSPLIIRAIYINKILLKYKRPLKNIQRWFYLK